MYTLKNMIRKNIYRIAGILVLLMFIMILTFQLMNEQRKAYRDADRTFLQMEQVLAENQAELIKIKDEYTQRCFHAA